jgi:hypothetical protein
MKKCSWRSQLDILLTDILTKMPMITTKVQSVSQQETDCCAAAKEGGAPRSWHSLRWRGF